MTVVLLWKEYRQQRALWLAIAFLAVLLVVSLGQILGTGSGWKAYQEDGLRQTLNMVLFCLAAAQGVVAGALLLAGEKEDGTLIFLDRLSGQRRALWMRKCAAGMVVTLSQGLVLTALAMGLGFASWRTVLYVYILGLAALAWGLLGGALCRTVLTAVLTGIALMGCSWLFIVYSVLLPVTALILPLGGVVAGYISWQLFCRDDKSRLQVGKQANAKRQLPSGRRVLMWLIFRQGRWVLAGCLAGALVLGCTVNLAPFVLWPVGTLLLGLACGLTVFVPDQDDGCRFLGSQRFPAGWIWTVKVLFWGTVVVVLTALAMGLALLFLYVKRKEVTLFSFDNYAWVEELASRKKLIQNVNPVLLLGLWPFYGFCFGQFFGQLARRPVIACVLTVFLTPLVVVLWMPSLLVGGVPVWQVLIVPVLLLLTTRLSQWPWMSGRLLTTRPLLGIVGGAPLMVACLAGSLWYRAVEVPDVGEPFDVKAFIASLPSGEKNEAGALMRSAAAGMKEDRKKVESELGPSAEELLKESRIGRSTGEFYGGLLHGVLSDYGEFIEHKDLGPWWDKDLGPWLDRLFEGEWAKQTQKVAHLPLGMVQDPRLTDLNTQLAENYQDYRTLADLFTARAFQLRARGEPRAALRHLETALALSRQVKSYSPGVLVECGNTMESKALSALYSWLRKIGPDHGLLRTALTTLRRHEAAAPDPANSVKAQFLIERNRTPSTLGGRVLIDKLLRIAYEAPWEKERQRRILNGIYQGTLREVHQPIPPNIGSADLRYASLHLFWPTTWRIGLPPETGLGSSLGEWEWNNEFHQQFRKHGYAGWSYASPQWPATRSQRALRAAQTVIAVALYQADHGSPPAKLADLVPAYLAALPNDPFTGQPFFYRIATKWEAHHDCKVVPGQALVWSGYYLEYYVPQYYPVPVWGK